MVNPNPRKSSSDQSTGPAHPSQQPYGFSWGKFIHDGQETLSHLMEGSSSTGPPTPNPTNATAQSQIPQDTSFSYSDEDNSQLSPLNPILSKPPPALHDNTYASNHRRLSSSASSTGPIQYYSDAEGPNGPNGPSSPTNMSPPTTASASVPSSSNWIIGLSPGTNSFSDFNFSSKPIHSAGIKPIVSNSSVNDPKDTSNTINNAADTTKSGLTPPLVTAPTPATATVGPSKVHEMVYPMSTYIASSSSSSSSYNNNTQKKERSSSTDKKKKSKKFGFMRSSGKGEIRSSLAAGEASIIQNSLSSSSTTAYKSLASVAQANTPVASKPSSKTSRQSDSGTTGDVNSNATSTNSNSSRKDSKSTASGPTASSSSSNTTSTSSSMTDKLIEKLVSAALPTSSLNMADTEKRAQLMKSNPAFSIQLMGRNFRNMSARTGVIYEAYYSFLKIASWQKPTHTLSVLGIYSIVVLNPRILSALPFLFILAYIMIPSYVYRHPPDPTIVQPDPESDAKLLSVLAPADYVPPPPSSGSSSNNTSGSTAGPNTNTITANAAATDVLIHHNPSPIVASGPPLGDAIIPKPVPEISREFFMNVVDTQNAMVLYIQAYDVTLECLKRFAFFDGDETTSSLVYIALIAAAFASYIITPLVIQYVPWRLVFLVLGWSAAISNHPRYDTDRVLIEPLKSGLKQTKERGKKTFKTVVKNIKDRRSESSSSFSLENIFNVKKLQLQEQEEKQKQKQKQKSDEHNGEHETKHSDDDANNRKSEDSLFVDDDFSIDSTLETDEGSETHFVSSSAESSEPETSDDESSGESPPNRHHHHKQSETLGETNKPKDDFDLSGQFGSTFLISTRSGLSSVLNSLPSTRLFWETLEGIGNPFDDKFWESLHNAAYTEFHYYEPHEQREVEVFEIQIARGRAPQRTKNKLDKAKSKRKPKSKSKSKKPQLGWTSSDEEAEKAKTGTGTGILQLKPKIESAVDNTQTDTIKNKGNIDNEIQELFKQQTTTRLRYSHWEPSLYTNQSYIPRTRLTAMYTNAVQQAQLQQAMSTLGTSSTTGSISGSNTNTNQKSSGLKNSGGNNNDSTKKSNSKPSSSSSTTTKPTAATTTTTSPSLASEGLGLMEKFANEFNFELGFDSESSKKGNTQEKTNHEVDSKSKAEAEAEEAKARAEAEAEAKAAAIAAASAAAAGSSEPFILPGLVPLSEIQAPPFWQFVPGASWKLDMHVVEWVKDRGIKLEDNNNNNFGKEKEKKKKKNDIDKTQQTFEKPNSDIKNEDEDEGDDGYVDEHLMYSEDGTIVVDVNEKWVYNNEPISYLSEYPSKKNQNINNDTKTKQHQKKSSSSLSKKRKNKKLEKQKKKKNNKSIKKLDPAGTPLLLVTGTTTTTPISTVKGTATGTGVSKDDNFKSLEKVKDLNNDNYKNENTGNDYDEEDEEDYNKFQKKNFRINSYGFDNDDNDYNNNSDDDPYKSDNSSDDEEISNKLSLLSGGNGGNGSRGSSNDGKKFNNNNNNKKNNNEIIKKEKKIENHDNKEKEDDNEDEDENEEDEDDTNTSSDEEDDDDSEEDINDYYNYDYNNYDEDGDNNESENDDYDDDNDNNQDKNDKDVDVLWIRRRRWIRICTRHPVISKDLSK